MNTWAKRRACCRCVPTSAISGRTVFTAARKGRGRRACCSGGGNVTELPVLVTRPYALAKGDVFRHISPSGGGYGRAADRPRAAVLADLEAGLISAGTALRDYGVTA